MTRDLFGNYLKDLVLAMFRALGETSALARCATRAANNSLFLQVHLGVHVVIPLKPDQTVSFFVLFVALEFAKRNRHPHLNLICHFDQLEHTLLRRVFFELVYT